MVINPSIEGLRRELSLLKKGNLTWRFYSRECEYIRPIIEYLDSSQLPNYEVFLVDGINVGFAASFERHDGAVLQVESSATDFFKGLMQSTLFKQDVDKALQEYESKARSERQYPDPTSLRQDLPNYVAEYLINQIESLPSHYLTQKFWEVFRTAFYRSHDFAAYLQRDEFLVLKRKSEDLKGISEELLARLESHRFSLCRDFDIPAAPLPTVQEL